MRLGPKLDFRFEWRTRLRHHNLPLRGGREPVAGDAHVIAQRHHYASGEFPFLDG